MVAKYVAGLTMNQMGKAYAAIKKLPKAKNKLAFQMPKKKGWRKPLLKNSKMFPEYSGRDLAIDAGILGGSYAVGKTFGIGYHNKDKKKKKKGA